MSLRIDYYSTDASLAQTHSHTHRLLNNNNWLSNRHPHWVLAHKCRLRHSITWLLLISSYWLLVHLLLSSHWLLVHLLLSHHRLLVHLLLSHHWLLLVHLLLSSHWLLVHLLLSHHRLLLVHLLLGRVLSLAHLLLRISHSHTWIDDCDSKTTIYEFWSEM